MVKTYTIENLDCAVCAAKIERAIEKIEGVKKVSVHFMTKKMRVEYDGEDIGTIYEQIQRVCKRIEPDCQIIERNAL